MERRYLVANKIDLVENRRVDEETGQRVNNTIFIGFYELISFSI